MSQPASGNLGKYEVLSEIGRGGMAVVYRAVDPRLDREVAIKVLPREFLHDPTFKDRFQREAKIIASLDHPAVVPILDIGEENGQPFLVMRYMPNGSLADYVHEPMPLDTVSTIVSTIADALDEVHDRGIIHRDIKPSNILFDQRGAAHLADFGIVKVTESTSQLTGSGIVGTPAYMAPEMANKDGLTPLVDIYALGVTIFQMLTGHTPFEASTPVGVLMAHATKPVPNIHHSRADLPEDIQDIIDHAMAKDPAQRYQSAGDLARDLAEVAAGRMVTVSVSPSAAATRPSPSFHSAETVSEAHRRADDTTADYHLPPAQQTLTTKPARRNLLPVFIGAFAVIALVIGGIILFGGKGGDDTGTASVTILNDEGEVFFVQDGEKFDLTASRALDINAVQGIGTADGLVAITLPDGSTLYLGPDTEITFTSLANVEGETDTLITLDTGMVLSYVNLIGENTFAIAKPNSSLRAAVTGSVMGVLHNPGEDRFDLDCIEGHCVFSWAGGFRNIEAGEYYFAEGENEPGFGGVARNDSYNGIGAPIVPTMMAGVDETEEAEATEEPAAETDDPTEEAQETQEATARPTSTPTTQPTPTATTVRSSGPRPTATPDNRRTEVKDVWFCEYKGSGEFEWWKVELVYVDDVLTEQNKLDGPFTGAWQPGCPAEPTPTQGRGSGGQPGLVYVFEDFNSATGFTLTNPSRVWISGGVVNLSVSRSGGSQWVYRSIPEFTGNVRVTVRGKIDSSTSNCGFFAGAGDGSGYRTGSYFNFHGGGCPTNGYNIRGNGMTITATELACSFTGNWLWIGPGTYYTATVTLQNGAANINVPGAGSDSGTPTYTGKINTLWVGLTGGGDTPTCTGTVDYVEIEQLP